jgi:ABC-type lipoprotein export system ATPase subunit
VNAAPAIELQDVFRIYDAPEGAAVALQGLSLAIGSGEIVAIVGPSGAGKSTLLRILAALDRPSAGSARVLDVDVARVRPRAAAQFRARSVGVLNQHYARSLSPELTCRESIGLRLALLGLPRPTIARRVDELLERVGLRDRADARPATLSGGEQQRVAVCAAVAHRPHLLLADEPAGELDARNAATIYTLLAELAREAGATAVVVSHDPDASAIASRQLTIRDGRLGEEALPGLPGRLVVARGGWVRLPDSLRRSAGIGDHARARAEGDAILLDGEEHLAPSPETQLTPSANAGGQPVAELRAATKRYGSGTTARTVFAELDAVFPAGRLSLVVGRSGSGKTTALNLLAGLARPSEGEVLVLGRPTSTLDRAALARLRRSDIGVVGQEPGLVPFLSAGENVELALALRGTDDAAATARAALEEVGLERRAYQRVDRLSAGERQRVALARALAQRPRLLLADEPSARLDEENAGAIAELLLRAARAHGMAVVCATHDPALIERGDSELRFD